MVSTLADQVQYQLDKLNLKTREMPEDDENSFLISRHKCKTLDMTAASSHLVMKSSNSRSIESTCLNQAVLTVDYADQDEEEFTFAAPSKHNSDATTDWDVLRAVAAGEDLFSKSFLDEVVGIPAQSPPHTLAKRLSFN